MKPLFRRFLLVLSLTVLIAGFTPNGFGQSDRYILRITNSSAFDIYHIYLSSSADSRWHRDLLGDSVLGTYDSINIGNITLGAYDLMLVDEDGDSCVRANVPFYGSKVLTITNDWLLGCEFHNSRR